MNHGEDENEKDVKDLVSSVTYSPYFDSSLNRLPSNELVATYMDNKVLECQSSDLTQYWQQNTWHDIKDICVDEGVHSKRKTTWEDTVDQKTICTVLLPQKDLKNEPETGNKESSVLSFDASLSSKSENLVQMVLTESKLPMKGLDGEEFRSSLKEGHKNGEPFSQISDEPTMDRSEESCSGDCEGIMFGDLVLPSDSKDIPGKRRVTFHFESSAPLASSKDTSEVTDRMDSDPTEVGIGESSFSSVGPLPLLVNYSGPISYSGSGNVSLRSDSSTTSARSFAFPIIQSEWNSSPVRMAKADRRQLRKHKGWRKSCLCCRF